MSQATDLIARVKGLVGDVEKDVKAFEKNIEKVGEFTDLVQLRKAEIHLGILRDSLADRTADMEQATAPAEPIALVEAAPVEPVTPETTEDPETETASDPDEVDEPAAESTEE